MVRRITYTRRFVNVTMTGGKRKVCETSRFPLRSDGIVASWWQTWNRVQRAKNGISLTFRSTDESEPYCLDDVGREGWKSWEGDIACLRMMGPMGCPNFCRDCVYLLRDENA